MLKGELLEKKKEILHLMADCVNACNHCFSSCLKEDDVKMMTDCIRLDKECAEVCSFTILMFHNSPFVDNYLELCIKVCDACGEECAKHDNEHCRMCAEACKKCADACRDFRQMFKK